VNEITGETHMPSWPVDLVLPSWCGRQDIDATAVLDFLRDSFGLDYHPVPINRGLFGASYYIITKDDMYAARLHVIKYELCATSVDDVVYGTIDLVLQLLYADYISEAKTAHGAERQQLAVAIDAVVRAQATDVGNSGIMKRFTPFNTFDSPPTAVSV
jgi:hypothetical protein